MLLLEILLLLLLKLVLLVVQKLVNNVKIGGQAGISGHLVIGDNVTIAAKSGVTKNIMIIKLLLVFLQKILIYGKKKL